VVNGEVKMWTPKPKPSWRSRAYHATIGFLVPLIAGRLGGYSAVAWAFAGACVAGIGWELATPILAGPLGWAWPHGDLSEAVAVVVGAAGGATGWLIWTRSRR